MKNVSRVISAAVGAAMVLSVLPGAASAYDPTDPGNGVRDSDGDGLSNYDEFLRGSDPSNPDSDGGGAVDGWEVLYGLDPTSQSDDIADTDGDGWSSWDEFTHGTNPLNPDTDNDGIRDSLDPNPLIPDGDQPPCEGDCGGIGRGEGPGDGSGGPGTGSGQGSGSGGQTGGQGNGQGQGAGQGAGQGGGNGQGSGQPPNSGNPPSDIDGDGIFEAGYEPGLMHAFAPLAGALPQLSLPSVG